MGAKESNIKLQEIKHEMKQIKKEIAELNELNKNETDEKYFNENENNINNLKNKYDELKKIYKSLKKGETVDIAVKEIHSLQNPYETTLVILEVQKGDIIDENDIERLSDIYGRK